MSFHALIGRLRGEIGRIEAKHQSPGSTRPAAVENAARTVGTPPSPSSVAGGRRPHRDFPPVAAPPPVTCLNIDGLTPLQRWGEAMQRLEWLLEYAEQCTDELAAERLERVRELIQRHEAEKPEGGKP